jgi:hypothetical protein
MDIYFHTIQFETDTPILILLQMLASDRVPEIRAIFVNLRDLSANIAFLHGHPENFVRVMRFAMSSLQPALRSAIPCRKMCRHQCLTASGLIHFILR